MFVTTREREAEILAYYRITAEELDRATRLTQEGKVFYQVESRSGNEPHEVRWNGDRLTCTCAAGRDNVPCWAQRAALAHSKLHQIALAAEKLAEGRREQEEAEAAESYRAEQAAVAIAQAQAILKAEESARRARQDEAAARQRLALNGNEDFSLLRKTATPQRGIDIRIQRVGSAWMSEQAHAWMTGDELPAAWTAICNDPSVVKAVCFPSAQRSWRADKRRNLAEYSRQGVAV